jgi:hypothetical protein
VTGKTSNPDRSRRVSFYSVFEAQHDGRQQAAAEEEAAHEPARDASSSADNPGDGPYVCLVFGALRVGPARTFA